MRWEDERYVRIYTRDTAEWLALGWEGQSLLMLLLRKADRAGIIHTGKAGVRGVAALSGMPLDVAQRALALLLEDGCLKAMEGGYVFPNFLAAQEAKSSDAQRKREQRARDREKALAGGASGSASGLDAEAALSRAAGHVSRTESRRVTGVTDSVTPSRAVPSLAVETTLSAGASPPAADDDLPDGTEHAEDDPQPVLLSVSSKPAEKPEDLQALWNAEAHASLPRWQGMSAARKQRAAARLRERPLAQWRDVIRRLSASPFCRGEEKGSTWKASPDWILQPDVADKVLEGKYDRPGATPAVLSREDEQARKRREAYERMTAAGGAQ